MKKKNCILVVVAVHIGFVFLQIHKQSYLVGVSFTNQRLEKQKKEFGDYKMKLQQELSLLQERLVIKKFAETSLGLQKIQLKQIKQIPKQNDEQSI